MDTIEDKKAPVKKGQTAVIEEEEEEPITAHAEKDLL